MDDRFLNRQEVSRITGLSASTIWRKQRDGTFPHRCQITVNRVAWKLSSIRAWMDERSAGSGIAPVVRKKEDAYDCGEK